MLLPKNLEIVTDKRGSYYKEIKQWHVRVCAGVTLKGMLEARMPYDAERSFLFVHINGYVDSVIEEAVSGSFAEKGHHIPLIMMKAIHHLRNIFNEACLEILDQAIEQREKISLREKMLRAMAKAHFIDGNLVTIEDISPNSSFWKEADDAWLSPQEFLIQRRLVLDISSHIPVTIASCEYMGGTLALLHGSGAFIVERRRLPNGKERFTTMEVDEDSLKIE